MAHNTDPNFLRARIAVLRMYIGWWRLTRERLVENAPDEEHDLQALGVPIVAVAIMLGTLEGQPMGASKIAAFLGAPRSTVRDKIKVLLRIKAIEKRDHCYVTAPSGLKMPKARADAALSILARAFADIEPALADFATKSVDGTQARIVSRGTITNKRAG
jgi:hypothetical protein